MPTDFSGIKTKIDLPSWQVVSPINGPTGAVVPHTAGSSLSGDRRPSQFKNHNLWALSSNTGLLQYSTRTNGWLQLASPALAGTFGIGSCTVFAPSQGPRGTTAAGATTTTFALTTALPAAVGANSLAGQRIRIITNTTGQGRTEERTIVANTSGTTPTITVDTALAAAPASGSTYEILSGRLFMLGAGTVAAVSGSSTMSQPIASQPTWQQQTCQQLSARPLASSRWMNCTRQLQESVVQQSTARPADTLAP